LIKIHWISESKRWVRDGIKEETPDTNLIGLREREREKQQT
jgi:hypothetical protein